MRLGYDLDSLIVRGLPKTFGAYVLLAQLLGRGWPLDWPALADWDSDGIATQPNAALAAILAGVGVIAMAGGRRRMAAVSGLVLGLIARLALPAPQWPRRRHRHLATSSTGRRDASAPVRPDDRTAGVGVLAAGRRIWSPAAAAARCAEPCRRWGWRSRRWPACR